MNINKISSKNVDNYYFYLVKWHDYGNIFLDAHFVKIKNKKVMFATCKLVFFRLQSVLSYIII